MPLNEGSKAKERREEKGKNKSSSFIYIGCGSVCGNPWTSVPVVARSGARASMSGDEPASSQQEGLGLLRGSSGRVIINSSNIRLEVSICKGCDFSVKLCKWFAEGAGSLRTSSNSRYVSYNVATG